MAQYILLLRETPKDFASFAFEEMQRIVGEYYAWRDQLEKNGTLVGSSKLADEGGKLLSQNGDGEVRVVDGPYAEAKEVLGGYFVIEADDYDQAVAISRGCPHLRYGGRIELRQIDLDHRNPS